MAGESGYNLSNEDPRILRLELDVDERLLDLWGKAMLVEEWSLDEAAAFMRAAYGKGYCDAKGETPEDNGSLIHYNGYRMPIPRPLPLDPI